MAKKAEVVNLEEIVADTESRRDQIWTDRMAMYLPSISTLIDVEDITIEKIIDEFVAGILQKERNSQQPQIYGQRVVDVI